MEGSFKSLKARLVKWLANLSVSPGDVPEHQDCQRCFWLQAGKIHTYTLWPLNQSKISYGHNLFSPLLDSCIRFVQKLSLYYDSHSTHFLVAFFEASFQKLRVSIQLKAIAHEAATLRMDIALGETHGGICREGYGIFLSCQHCRPKSATPEGYYKMKDCSLG